MNSQCANASHWAGLLESFGSQIHSRSPGRQKDHKGDTHMRAPFEPSTESPRRSSSRSWDGSNSTQEKKHFLWSAGFAGSLPGQHLGAQWSDGFPPFLWNKCVVTYTTPCSRDTASPWYQHWKAQLWVPVTPSELWKESMLFTLATEPSFSHKCPRSEPLYISH